MELPYYNKYMKYKQKYIILKKQSGGAKPSRGLKPPRGKSLSKLNQNITKQEEEQYNKEKCLKILDSYLENVNNYFNSLLENNISKFKNEKNSFLKNNISKDENEKYYFKIKYSNVFTKPFDFLKLLKDLYKFSKSDNELIKSDNELIKSNYKDFIENLKYFIDTIRDSKNCNIKSIYFDLDFIINPIFYTKILNEANIDIKYINIICKIIFYNIFNNDNDIKDFIANLIINNICIINTNYGVILISSITSENLFIEEIEEIEESKNIDVSSFFKQPPPV